MPYEAVAAVYLGRQGPSSVPEAVLHPDLTTVQKEIVWYCGKRNVI